MITKERGGNVKTKCSQPDTANTQGKRGFPEIKQKCPSQSPSLFHSRSSLRLARPRIVLAPFFQPVWLHHISFLLHQLGFVMPTTISSIPFLFIYPYMPIFVFFCIDMRAFACGCAPACFCERGVPSHLFVSLSFFFCHGQLSCYIS